MDKGKIVVTLHSLLLSLCISTLVTTDILKNLFVALIINGLVYLCQGVTRFVLLLPIGFISLGVIADYLQTINQDHLLTPNALAMQLLLILLLGSLVLRKTLINNPSVSRSSIVDK